MHQGEGPEYLTLASADMPISLQPIPWPTFTVRSIPKNIYTLTENLV
jgi:hypothetical protein